MKQIRDKGEKSNIEKINILIAPKLFHIYLHCIGTD